MHHTLQRTILEYHHIPTHVINIVESLYQDYFTSIATDEYITAPIRVSRGVLQGDSLSPLLFNLVVNMLINSIKQGKTSCIGYVYDGCISPKHWMQFADDTAIVTSLESDNQHLINALSKWASWAGLLVRVDKCKSFAMKKVSTSTVQYEPYLTVNDERIPPVELNDQMTYLGKDFNFLMSCDHIKNQLTTEIDQYLQKTNLLPLHPQQKIQF